MSLNGSEVENALSCSEEFSPQILTASQMTNENPGSSQGDTIDGDECCERSSVANVTTASLDQIIESVETFAGIKEETLLKIIKLVGLELRSEIKREANFFRSKKSREEEETLLKTPAERRF